MSRIPPKVRREVIKRVSGFCEYYHTDSTFSDSPFDVEHIIAVAVGGKTNLENLALSCHGCNLHKSSKTTGYDVLSEEIVRLFHPRTDAWDKHFDWANNYSEVVGLTNIGRATVETLKLNRKGLVNQRNLLFRFGEHSPNKI